MKKTFAILLIGAVASSYAFASSAATAEDRIFYKTSTEKAAVDYKIARERCTALSGNSKAVCVEQAEAARIHVRADAEAHYKNTPRARDGARIEIANAEYELAKAKCGSRTGNDKDVCVEQAKAANVAAKADAKADKKVTLARTEASHDKHEADYKVAREKCDAFAGVAKDNCIVSAKSEYDK